jgi:hypothetical protein
MSKIKNHYLVFPLILLSFCFFTDAEAQTSTSSLDSATSTSATSSILNVPQIPQLLVQIKQAKEILAPVKLNYALKPIYKTPKATKKVPKPKAVLSRYDLTAKDVALAILDPATNQISVTLGMQTGKTMSFEDPNFEVKLIRFNGVNSRFQVSKPAGGIVLALKYLIVGTESGNKAAIEGSFSEAIYVPYSPLLEQPDVIAYGGTYLDSIIEQVANELKVLPSQAVPGKTITEAIKPSLIKSLVYAEHTDTAELLNTPNTQDVVNRIKVLFATNEGDTYKYSLSSANARGISQFIPSTYEGLVKRHPEAELNPDYIKGMEDHKNAIKATYLLVDDYTGAVRVKAQNGFAEGMAFDYGAASYNGGTTRIARAVDAFGVNWNADRNGQINSLQSQVNSLTSKVKNLKAQIKKTTDKKTKTSLQSQLNIANAELNTATSELTQMKDGTLRNETINYLQKIYKVIPLFN